jgi:dGTPase
MVSIEPPEEMAGDMTVPATEPATEPIPADQGERALRWASTMDGYAGTAAVRRAHRDSHAGVGSAGTLRRGEREHIEDLTLAPGATRAREAGSRALREEPDPLRTCFERDRDRILHATAFRRLAGKTQVFIFPQDHQRTRLTHAIEVAQVAVSLARAARVNVALTEAIALGHDCGHGPGGHACEDALSPYVASGFDHAVWGADVVLAPLNLCAETLDGVRNHSWSRPAPTTPEGEIVSWADRIAYVCHDFEDAVRAGIVTPAMLPERVRRRCGHSRGEQLGAFIAGVLEAMAATGEVGMSEELAAALAEFRATNYERIYLRPASVAQGQGVARALRALVEHFADRPNLIPGAAERGGVGAGGEVALSTAVTYVAGMTDRYVMQSAAAHLGWDADRLPGA